ncbi:MAG: hypothetical protein RL111_1290 [Pseudomonadota bacterium]
MKSLESALRAMVRDWRAGELRLLWMAVALGVAVLSAVTFLSNRLQATLIRDAAEWLGGDVVLSLDRPPPQALLDQVRELNLTSSLTVSLPTMGRAMPRQSPLEGDSRLVALKAVTDQHPLKGQLRVLPQQSPSEPVPNAALVRHPNNATAYDLAPVPIQAVPRPGTVWLEPGALEALNLQVGDELGLGELTLRIERVLASEPDRGMGFMSLAPRVLMNMADLPASELIQPASRATWRLALVGPSAAIDRFVAWSDVWLDTPAGKGIRLDTLQSGRPEMRQTLDRAVQFMHLVGLLSALLCAVSVAMAAHHFAQRKLNDCALLRVMGQSQSTLTRMYFWEFVGVGLIASALGVALGWATHWGFVSVLERWLEKPLAEASWNPVWHGMGSGLVLLMAFGLPPVLQLASVPPLRVIRRELGQIRASSLGVWSLGMAGFAALMLRMSDDLQLGGLVVGGFMLAVFVFAAVAGLALWLLRMLQLRIKVPFALALATRQLAARPGFAMLQVGALSAGLLALISMAMLRTDLIQGWRSATPADAPNRFVINIQADQAQDFMAHLREQGIVNLDWYPMLRGRLVAINDRSIRPDEFSDQRAKSRIEREQNLSYANAMPAHNAVVAGLWQANDNEGLSIEESMAKSLGVGVGDWLSFEMADQLVKARITSVRRVDWASMHVNFFFMFPRERMPEGLAQTFISAFRAPGKAGFDRQLVDRFPNVTNIDVGQTIDQVQSVVTQVVQVVEFLFGFTLLAGLLVLFATVSFNREARSHDYAVLRALGSGRGQIVSLQQIELVGVGALSGFLAAVASMLLGSVLAAKVFQFTWTASPIWLVLGTGGGALLAHLAGRWALRDVLAQPVVQTLRASTQA